RKVIVVPPLSLAASEKLTERAVVDGVRVRRASVVDRVEKPLPDAPVVGEEVGGPERLPLPEPVDYVHPLRPAPLNPSELLGVEAKLKQVRRLGPPSELGVDDLVRAVRLQLEEVRVPAPAVRGEARLVDDVCACGANHLFGAPRGALPIVAVGAKVGDGEPGLFEPRHGLRLVRISLSPNQISVRVDPNRPSDLASRNGNLERRQMRAREEVVEICRREQQLTVIRTHSSSVASTAAPSRPASEGFARTAAHSHATCCRRASEVKRNRVRLPL